MRAADVTWAVGRPTLGTLVKVIRHGSRSTGGSGFREMAGIVIACNHFSWLDPAALGASCPRTIYYMAKVEAHRAPGLGALIRAFGCFPVRRGESDREAVRTMRQVVRDGLALGLFVEGSRQRSGVPGAVQAGRGDGRAPGERPHRPGGDARIADVEARELPSRLDRLGRAA